jgi:hypothetical protein
VGGVGVAAESGTDSGNAIGGDGSAYTSAAHDDAAFGVMPQNRERYLLGIVGAMLLLSLRRGTDDFMAVGEQLLR